MIPEQLFPATAMPDRDWWHALWPAGCWAGQVSMCREGGRVSSVECLTAVLAPRSRRLGGGQTHSAVTRPHGWQSVGFPL